MSGSTVADWVWLLLVVGGWLVLLAVADGVLWTIARLRAARRGARLDRRPTPAPDTPVDALVIAHLRSGSRAKE